KDEARAGTLGCDLEAGALPPPGRADGEAARYRGWLPGGSREISGNHAGGVPVEGGPGPVIPHGGPRIGGRGGLLNIARRDACVEGRGEECGPQRWRRYGFGDPGSAGHAADDAGGAVPVQPGPIGGKEDRAFTSFADREIDGAGGARRKRDRDDLAALSDDGQRPVAALVPEGL